MHLVLIVISTVWVYCRNNSTSENLCDNIISTKKILNIRNLSRVGTSYSCCIWIYKLICASQIWCTLNYNGIKNNDLIFILLNIFYNYSSSNSRSCINLQFSGLKFNVTNYPTCRQSGSGDWRLKDPTHPGGPPPPPPPFECPSYDGWQRGLGLKL